MKLSARLCLAGMCLIALVCPADAEKEGRHFPDVGEIVFEEHRTPDHEVFWTDPDEPLPNYCQFVNEAQSKEEKDQLGDWYDDFLLDEHPDLEVMFLPLEENRDDVDGDILNDDFYLDTWVYSLWTDTGTNYGYDSDMDVGYYWILGDGWEYGLFAAYACPPGLVVSAKLWVNIIDNRLEETQTYNVTRPTATWDEYTVTWDNKPGMDGATVDGTICFTSTTGSDWFYATKALQSVCNNGTANYGLYFWHTNGAHYTHDLKLKTYETESSPASYLEINYDPTCYIGSTHYYNGTVNPSNTCQICNTSLTRYSWSNRDGVACDDGAYCNGNDTCSGGSCSVHAGDPCTGDGVACTDDSCNEGTDSCDYTPNNTNCDNGQHCDGPETCHATLGCQDSADPNCNDGVACTDDSCNEGTDSCDNIANNANCDNGQHCDGAETCHATLGCQDGADPNCNDGVGCTDDSCNEGTDTCDNIANNANCDNGQWCDGSETCHATLDCQNGADACPDDGVFCNGSETCDEGAETCGHSGNPCSGLTPYCYCDSPGVNCQCHSDTAIDLIVFAAERTDEGVVLSWITGSELQCGAFTILRCEMEALQCLEDSYCALKDHVELSAVIPCDNDPNGSGYEVLDDSASVDTALSYYLREYETDGNVMEYGPLVLSAGEETGRFKVVDPKMTPVDDNSPSDDDDDGSKGDEDPSDEGSPESEADSDEEEDGGRICG